MRNRYIVGPSTLPSAHQCLVDIQELKHEFCEAGPIKLTVLVSEGSPVWSMSWSVEETKGSTLTWV